MTNPSSHLAFHQARHADVVRETRHHPLARVHPLERRAPLSRLFMRRRSDEAYVREFRVA